MKLLPAIIGASIFGAAVNTAKACQKYTDCACKFKETTTDELNGQTDVYNCAEVDTNGDVLWFNVDTSACSPDMGRRCWCDLSTSNPNTDIGGGTCVYARQPPPTGSPTVSSPPSISMHPSISAAPSVSAAPSISSGPSISTQPSVSAQPSMSAAPSTSSGPSISSQPSVSAAPSASSAPSIEKTGSISGKVWNDVLDKNGLDTNEPGLPDRDLLLICIRDGELTYVDSTQSAADGSYRFDNVKVGMCQIVVVPTDSRYSYSPIRPESNGNKANADGKTELFEVKDNEENDDINIGMFFPSAHICGPIFNDPDKDGVQEEGEEGIPDVTVQLVCKEIGGGNNGGYLIVDTKKTDASGMYSFEVNDHSTCYVHVVPPDDGVYTFSHPTDSIGKTPEIEVDYGDSLHWPVGLQKLPPAHICGPVFDDPNKNGIQEAGEQGIPNVTVELVCKENGSQYNTMGITKTDAQGRYCFEIAIKQATCYVQVVRPDDGYTFSPPTDSSGKTPERDVDYGDTVDWPVGMQSMPDANCDARKCSNKVIDPVLGYHDCGWGIFNDCTCECVCDPGVCLSDNSKCYDGCMTHLDFNTYGGCEPGIDCPWYRSKSGEPHCESSANFAGIHGIRESAELCCKQHFSYVNLSTCVANSKADVVAEKAKVAQDLARKKYFYPDMYGRQNCVFDSDYEDWMMGANKDHFLFENHEQCCGNWYPTKSNCPDLASPTTPKQLDYKPNASAGYFYPHMSGNNCRFGRNYPMWMKISPKHYLYTTPEECCSTWYPNESNCPMQEDDGVQSGYFWIVDEAFYPNWKGDGCAHGNDYPEWMAADEQKDTHLFKTAKDCCQLWFPSNLALCEASIVETQNGEQVGGPANYNSGLWYPSLNGKYLCIDGNPPEWMTQEGYKEKYIFDSHAECCKAHYCEDIRGVVQS